MPDHEQELVQLEILAADDDPNDELLLETAFARTGLKASLRFVHDGCDVMDYLSRRPPYQDPSENPWPSLLFLDLKMPRAGGFEVLQWLGCHRDLPPLFVAILTDSTSPDEITRCYALGADACLTKPFGLARFSSMVQALSRHCSEMKRNHRRSSRRYAGSENLFASNLRQGGACAGSPVPRIECR